MKTEIVISEIQRLIESTPGKFVTLRDIYKRISSLKINSSPQSIRARICERTVNSKTFWSSSNEAIFFRLGPDKKRNSTYTLFKYLANDFQKIRDDFQDSKKPSFEDLFKFQ